MLEKIENKQTKDRIAEMLRDEILSGRVLDGTELTQEELAFQLEVSRMPVREALQILELEGLLLRLPNRHMRVVGINERTIFENFRLIASVEYELASILLSRGFELGSSESEFQTILINRIDNVYLKQNYKKLLSGYPKYILNHCDKNMFIDKINGIKNSFMQKNEDQLKNAIYSYYNALAEELIKQSKENSHE